MAPQCQTSIISSLAQVSHGLCHSYLTFRSATTECQTYTSTSSINQIRLWYFWARYVFPPHALGNQLNQYFQVGAGLTFKVFEWQAVAAARVLAGKATLPPLSAQKKWEEDRIAKKGDAAGFLMVYPDFELYFEQLRTLAGEPAEGEPGRRLPPFEKVWPETFAAGHQRRIRMWKRANEAAKARDDVTDKSHL